MYRAETLGKFLNIAARTPLFWRRRNEKRSELLNGVRQRRNSLHKMPCSVDGRFTRSSRRMPYRVSATFWAICQLSSCPDRQIRTSGIEVLDTGGLDLLLPPYSEFPNPRGVGTGCGVVRGQQHNDYLNSLRESLELCGKRDMSSQSLHSKRATPRRDSLGEYQCCWNCGVSAVLEGRLPKTTQGPGKRLKSRRLKRLLVDGDHQDSAQRGGVLQARPEDLRTSFPAARHAKSGHRERGPARIAQRNGLTKL